MCIKFGFCRLNLYMVFADCQGALSWVGMQYKCYQEQIA